YGRKLTANDMEVESWLLHVAGQSVSAAAYSASLAAWDLAGAQMARFHEIYDFYVTPAAAYGAPKIGELTHSEKEAASLISEIEQLDAGGQQELIYEMFLPSLTYTPFT